VRNRALPLAAILCLLLLSQCGYRAVRPYSGKDLSLNELRNVTEEPFLTEAMEEALAKVAGLRRDGGDRKVDLVITGFSERVQSVTSSGDPVRERISMTFEWRISGQSEDAGSPQRGDVSRTYLWSPDLNILDWNRRAAIRLLAEDGAGLLADQIEVVP
jgi:outer membrane lipopolysaccharide assembly protein LptE/RlpB